LCFADNIVPILVLVRANIIGVCAAKPVLPVPTVINQW